AGREHAAELAHGGAVVRHVLEHVRAEDEVVAGVRAGEGVERGVEVDPGNGQVGRLVRRLAAGEGAAQARLRGDVEDAPRAAEDVGSAAEEQVQEALAVGRAAPRALRLAQPSADDAELRVHRQVAAARLEPAEGQVAERAAVAEPELGQHVEHAADGGAHQACRYSRQPCRSTTRRMDGPARACTPGAATSHWAGRAPSSTKRSRREPKYG